PIRPGMAAVGSGSFSGALASVAAGVLTSGCGIGLASVWGAGWAGSSLTGLVATGAWASVAAAGGAVESAAWGCAPQATISSIRINGAVRANRVGNFIASAFLFFVNTAGIFQEVANMAN